MVENRTFLGIGAGPIQTGIFVAGTSKGGFSRIVLADVDPKLVAAIRASKSITVNTAGADSITTDTYKNIEIYNPSIPEELAILKEYASTATVINTALPATKFYSSCAPWLKEAFAKNPQGVRYVYTSENSTTAAAELEALIGKQFPNTYFIDTVIGKMSKIFTTEESKLPPLAPGYFKGHLVESFCTIYSTSAPEIDDLGIVGLYAKKDLVPFEEAKLYGHNASHFLLGILAYQRGCTYMSDAVKYPEILKICEHALLKECGPALCKKYAGVDEYFTKKEYDKWGKELIRRMTSLELKDSVDRVIRDIDRKLAWNDRCIGAIRLCLSQGVEPKNLMLGANLAARLYGLRTVSEKWDASQGADLCSRIFRQL